MTAQIAADRCRPLATAPGFALRADAADAWDRAVRAFGSRVLLSGAWRSYADQERLFRARYTPGNLAGRPGYTTDVRRWNGQPTGTTTASPQWTRRAGQAAAAVPGTSNHGAGLSVDVKTTRSPGDQPRPGAVVFTGFADPDRVRFLSVARPHGWADDEGRSVGEPWHLTYYPARDTRPTAPTAPPPPSRKGTDVIELIRTLYRRYLDRYPTAADELAWSDATSDKTPAQAHQLFRGSAAETGTVRQAYRAHLGREPGPAEVKAWSDQHLTIGQVFDRIAASAEAAAKR